MSALLQMALRYLHRHARRYVFVMIVLALGFAFITVASSLSDGMEQAVTNAALRHYAGHLFVIGRDKQGGNKMAIDHPEDVAAAIEEAGVPAERIVRRTHEHLGASVFFAGESARLKDVFGVDFAAEADLFRGFEYAQGSFDPDWGSDTVVISEPTARRLGVRVGDRLVLRLETRNEQLNTATLIVRAVTADESIWGYARAYVPRETLTDLMGLAPAEYSMVGVFLPDPGEATRWARRLQAELDTRVPTAGRIETKEMLTQRIRESWEGVRYFVFALPVYISEVTDLLEAMKAGSYALLAMIILVVLAAVVVTYRVVLHDRRREIGTMLAVGFPRPWIVSVLVAEAAILLVAGMAAGGLLSLAITWAVSFLSFDWIPGFEIFMQGGQLTARYTAARLAANIAVVLGIVLPVIAVMVVRMVGHEIPSLIKGETT